MKTGMYSIDLGREEEEYESEANVVYQGIVDYNWHGTEEKTACFSVEDWQGHPRLMQMNKTELQGLMWFCEHLILDINKLEEQENENN